MKNILTTILSELNVRYTYQYANRLFRETPDRNNFFGLAYMLSVYGIESHGYYVAGKDISDVQFPFVAQTNSGFVLALELSGNNILCHNGKGKQYVDIALFKESWSGNLLLIEKGADSGEIDYTDHQNLAHLKALKSVVLYISVLTVVAGLLVSHFSARTTSILSYLALCFLGVGISRVLLERQWNSESQIGNIICSAFSNGSCDTVAQSAGSRTLFGISWAEVGFGYFLSTFLSLIFCPECFLTIGILGFLTLPFSFWSLWYQKVKIKKHCPLCIMIILIIWGMSSIVAVSDLPISNFDFTHLMIIPLYVITVILIHFYSSLRDDVSTKEREKLLYRSTLCRKKVFSELLEEQPFIKVDEDDSHILAGNIYAKQCLTVISNPFCKPCIHVHKVLMRLLKSRKDIMIRYIFVANNAPLQTASRYLVGSYYSYGESSLNEWFNLSAEGRELLMGLIDKSEKYEDTEDELRFHKAFIERNEIKWTPTILFNGHMIPPVYTAEDLTYTLFE